MSIIQSLGICAPTCIYYLRLGQVPIPSNRWPVDKSYHWLSNPGNLLEMQFSNQNNWIRKPGSSCCFLFVCLFNSLRNDFFPLDLVFNNSVQTLSIYKIIVASCLVENFCASHLFIPSAKCISQHRLINR